MTNQAEAEENIKELEERAKKVILKSFHCSRQEN